MGLARTTSSSRELAADVNFWAHPRPTESDTGVGVGGEVCVLKKPSGHSAALNYFCLVYWKPTFRRQRFVFKTPPLDFWAQFNNLQEKAMASNDRATTWDRPPETMANRGSGNQVTLSGSQLGRSRAGSQTVSTCCQSHRPLRTPPVPQPDTTAPRVGLGSGRSPDSLKWFILAEWRAGGVSAAESIQRKDTTSDLLWFSA